MTLRHAASLVLASRRVGALLPAIVLASAVASPSQALTPKTDNLVTDVGFDIPGDERVEDETAFIDQALCRELAANNETFTVRFTLSVDLSETVNEESRFRNTFLFDVERNSTSAITCPQNDCAEVGEDFLDITTQSVLVDVSFQELTGITTADECVDLDREFFVRLDFTRDIGGSTALTAEGRVIVDTIVPAAPTLSKVIATEGSIRVEFEPVSDADVFRYAILFDDAFFEGAPEESGASIRYFGRAEATSGSVDADLSPGDTVWVGVAAQDEAGNLSALTDVREAQVIETTDFWELYKGEGGSEAGGCSTARLSSASSNASTWLLGLIALAAARIRRNRRSPRRDR